MLPVQSSRNGVILLSYESKPTDKREQNDSKAEKNFNGCCQISSFCIENEYVCLCMYSILVTRVFMEYVYICLIFVLYAARPFFSAIQSEWSYSAIV